jgi:hypothetical protein
VTIQLTPADADLIGWLLTIPAGQRQGIMKRALRAEMSKRPANADPIEQVAVDTAQLREDAAWLRQALEDLPSYLNSLLAGLGGGWAPPSPPAVEEAPRLSDTDAAKIKANMLKKKW